MIPLKATSLTVGYGKKTVLSNVDVSLTPGTITILAGPNGCGKSTMLRTLAGLQPSLGGHVEIEGKSPNGMSRRELSRCLAFLPQSSLVPAGVTVRELARHGRYAHAGPLARHTAEDREAVSWALSVTDSLSLADRRLDELSGGERQRAWLATVLAQRSRILLLDEPTTYLDLRHQVDLLELVRSVVDEYQMACGVVLHDLGQAAAYGDVVMLVAGGELISAGAPRAVLTGPAISRAFGLDVEIVQDTGSGHIACFPRLGSTNGERNR
jgi:ABC-type cobalamin/Fe3+-siderophores transport system ATPase subunit